MAYCLWQKFDTLITHKTAIVKNYQFFQQLWQLQKHNQKSINELIRFQIVPELKFFDSDLIDLKRYKTEEGFKYVCKLNFMGLVGTYGILPVYFKELLLKRENTQQLQVLYDLLQQRSIQLAYEAWSRRQWYVQIFSNNHLLPFLASLTDGKTIALQDDYDRQVLNYFCAYFLSNSRSIHVLEKLLAEVLQSPVSIISMQGGWSNLPKEASAHLVSHYETSGKDNLSLGVDTILGRKIWCPERGLKIKIKFTHSERLMEFLPGGELYQLLARLISLFAGQSYQWSLSLELPSAVIAPCKLNNSSWARLGQLSILGKYHLEKNFTINLGVIKNESN